MASSASQQALRRPRRRWLWLALAILALLAWFWTPLSRLAHTGSAYGAHVVCSCHFIGGRDMGQCRKDLMPGMSPVSLSADAELKSVTARYLLLFPETARYREGEGCVLDKWDD